MELTKRAFRNILLLGVLTVWVPGLFCLNPSVASDLTNDPDEVQDANISALVMEVNQKEALIIVGEKRIYITKLIPGSKFKTDLLDQTGREIQLGAFRIGERVLVKGYKLPDGAIQAESIRKIPHHPTDITN